MHEVVSRWGSLRTQMRVTVIGGIQAAAEQATHAIAQRMRRPYRPPAAPACPPRPRASPTGYPSAELVGKCLATRTPRVRTARRAHSHDGRNGEATSDQDPGTVSIPSMALVNSTSRLSIIALGSNEEWAITPWMRRRCIPKFPAS